MQDTLQALLGLQETDRKIFRVEAEVKRLPLELEKRQAEFGEAAQALDRRNVELREVRGRIKEIEDITVQQRQRIRKLEGEATGNRIDAAMLAAYEHEIRTLKRTVSRAEEDGLVMVGESEDLEKDIETRSAALEETRTVFAEFQANVESELADAGTRLTDLRAVLAEGRSSAVSAEHLALYRRILGMREGEAMAPLSGQICQACFVEIPKNVAVRLARGVELVQCPSCHRILYPS
ncbi:MAG: putative nucleic acid-binding Zn-ribbon protein [Chlamydiales bacterium]|jgi:predicted  nucleic acid-binding Zn-ribbon protein